MRNSKALLMIAILSWLGLGARAVQVGEAAPAFSGKATGGKTVSLSDFKGGWLALYFYPKADTPGCTKESCSLRDGFKELQDAGVRILGVSVDDVEDQEAFKKKYNLPFDLLADTSKETAKAYGSLGIGGLVASRKTFLISPEGKVAHIFENVDVKAHAQQVVVKIRELQKK